MDEATKLRLIRLFGEPGCPHPERMGWGSAQAHARLMVRLQNGREITVCRICWEVVRTPVVAA